MGFWSQCQKNPTYYNFGFGWRGFGTDTDTEIRYQFRFPIPIPNFGRTLAKALTLIYILCLDNVSELLLYLLEFGHIVFLTTEHFFFILVEQVSFSEAVHSNLFTVWQSFLQSYIFVQSPLGFEAYSMVWQSKFSDLGFLLYNCGFQFWTSKPFPSEIKSYIAAWSIVGVRG